MPINSESRCRMRVSACENPSRIEDIFYNKPKCNAEVEKQAG
jgi:hypothetical protein